MFIYPQNGQLAKLLTAVLARVGIVIEVWGVPQDRVSQKYFVLAVFRWSVKEIVCIDHPQCKLSTF